jgi:hypothetical protein
MLSVSVPSRSNTTPRGRKLADWVTRRWYYAVRGSPASACRGSDNATSFGEATPKRARSAAREGGQPANATGSCLRRRLTTPAAGRRTRLFGESAARDDIATLALERSRRRARSLGRRTRRPLALSRAIGAARTLSRSRRRLTSLRRSQLDARAPRFGESNRNRLLRRARAVLPLTDVFDLFANELAGLRGRRLPFTLGPSRAFQCLLFRHKSPLRRPGIGMHRDCQYDSSHVLTDVLAAQRSDNRCLCEVLCRRYCSISVSGILAPHAVRL